MHGHPAAPLVLLAAPTRTGFIPGDLGMVRQLRLIPFVLGRHRGDRPAHLRVLRDRRWQDPVDRVNHRLEGLLACGGFGVEALGQSLVRALSK